MGETLETLGGGAHPRPGSVLNLRLAAKGTPSWVRIPVRLAEAWARRQSKRAPDGTLGEILWGQYALFLHIRIQDDLLDAQRHDLRLLFAAEHFLLESMRTFLRFRRLEHDFWAFYTGCLRDTIEGAQQAGRLEKAPGAFQARDLDLLARTSAILKVGANALCRLTGHERDAVWLSRLQHHLAIANQIEDDLRDLPSDVRSGRYTWVANALLDARAGTRQPPRQLARRLAAGLMLPERGARIVAQLRRSAHEAAAAVPASAPGAIHDLVREIEAAPDILERRMHETRVRWFFGDVPAALRRTAGGATAPRA